MWKYRELIINLALSDLKSRYQNTILGFFWSLLSPFLMSMVLFFVFRSIFKQEENFLLNLLVGMMAWRFFLVSTNASLMSIVIRYGKSCSMSFFSLVQSFTRSQWFLRD